MSQIEERIYQINDEDEGRNPTYIKYIENLEFETQFERTQRSLSNENNSDNANLIEIYEEERLAERNIEFQEELSKI